MSIDLCISLMSILKCSLCVSFSQFKSKTLVEPSDTLCGHSFCDKCIWT